MRLFVALPLPDPIAQSLLLIQGGVPGARWQDGAQLHLTLRFIGEVDGREAAMLDDALSGILAPGFSLQLHGVGQFGNKQPHSLWAAARPNPALDHLQRKVDNAIRRVSSSVSQDRYAQKFTPHVTLARLRNPDPEKIADWLTYNALYTSNAFYVSSFHLYTSLLTSDGSIYRIEQDYLLEVQNDETGN